MKREQILSLIRGLAMSTGMYGRLYNEIMDMPDKEEYFAYLESLNFATDLEVVLYFEEGTMPAGYERPAMTDDEIKKVVAEELVAMIQNNIINGYGVESFRGWVEDGSAFFNKGMTDEEIERAMKLVAEIETPTDIINQVLGEL